MSLILYLHPLASYCHKVMLPLAMNGTAYKGVTVDFQNEGEAAAHLARWPIGKIPLLHDTARDVTLGETSIIIEYLDRLYPGPQRMIPQDPDAALEVRLWDRFFDLYVSTPMQKIVIDRIKPEGAKDAAGVAEARALLQTAYGMLESHMETRDWAAGGAFSLADCSAFPALFYASTLEPLPAHVQRYFDRIVELPAAQAVLAEARPWFGNYPYHEAIPARFL